MSRIGKGGYFGELGLISHQPRAADVVAFGPTKCAGEQLRCAMLMNMTRLLIYELGIIR